MELLQAKGRHRPNQMASRDSRIRRAVAGNRATDEEKAYVRKNPLDIHGVWLTCRRAARMARSLHLDEIYNGLADPDCSSPGWGKALMRDVEEFQVRANDVQECYTSNCLREDLLIISDALDDILYQARQMRSVN